MRQRRICPRSGRAGRAAPAPDAEEAPFDEAWYVDAYPDVRDAVAGGTFESGHDHWLRFGKAEGRMPSGGGGGGAAG